MSQSCYWLSIASTTDGGCPSAELHWFQGAEQFQNANVAIETFRFRKVSPFLAVSPLFGLERLILPAAAVSKRTIVCPLGVFYSMSLISSDAVLDDSETPWVSADLVADIDPVPPYCR
jgi:hypothetical protein